MIILSSFLIVNVQMFVMSLACDSNNNGVKTINDKQYSNLWQTSQQPPGYSR